MKWGRHQAHHLILLPHTERSNHQVQKIREKRFFFQYVNWFLIKSGIIREDGNYKTAGDFSIMKFWAAWIENCYLKNWTVYENILHVVRLQIERAFIKKFMRTQWVEIWKKLKLMQEKKNLTSSCTMLTIRIVQKGWVGNGYMNSGSNKRGTHHTLWYVLYYLRKTKSGSTDSVF